MSVRGQAGSPLAFGGCVLLPNFRTLPPLLLTFGCLPTLHFFAAVTKLSGHPHPSAHQRMELAAA